jgi:peroxiredoxin
VLGTAPTWSLATLDGEVVGTETLKGKVVVVDFWATWCGPCVHEIPGYVAMQKKYGARGLVIVGLSVDQKGADAVVPFAKKKAINYPLALADAAVAAAFGGVEFLPTTFLIDREGRIRHKKTGAMDAADYEKLVVPLL